MLQGAAHRHLLVSRRSYTSALYKFAKKVMPKISNTERAALNAGTVGFDRVIFGGSPSLKHLRDYDVRLSQEEQEFLDKVVRPLCEQLDDYKIVQNRDLPEVFWETCKKKGLFGMMIPKEYGGKGFSAHMHSQVVQLISSRSGNASATVTVPNSLGPGELLVRYGTKQQKDYFLPKLANGDLIPCFGLTAPHSGSDAASLIGSDGTIVQKDGKVGIVASFKKRYITLAPVAGVVGVALNVKDPDNLLKGKGSAGVTLVLLERDHPGLKIGPRHDPLMAAFMNGTVEGENVFIPMDAVIGGQERCGFGWNMLMDCLAEGRAVSLPGSAVGASKLALNAVGAYSRIRKQFKVPVAELSGVQEPLARIAGNAFIMTAGQQLINSMLAKHEQPAVLGAIMKYEATSRAREVANDGMDIVGGAGICRGPNNFMGNGYMNVPIAITVEGANILTRTMIIFGQGLTRAHPHLYDLIKTLEGDANDLKGFTRELNNIVKHAFSNTFNSVSRALFRERSSGKPSNLVTYYESQLSRLAANFAIQADLCLTIGGMIKFEEMLSGRMADALGRLYLGYACLWYYQKVGGRNVEGLDDVLVYSMNSLLYECQEALKGVATNFPIKPVGWLMRGLTFPTGSPYKAPTDAQKKKVARLASTPNAFRDLLAENMFISSNANDQIRRLNDFLPKAVEADKILSKARKEKRQLTAAEQALVDEVEKARDAIIQVDVFQRLGAEVHEGPDYVRPALKGTRFVQQPVRVKSASA